MNVYFAWIISFSEGRNERGFLHGIHELPMSGPLIHVVAALLEFLHVVGAQEGGRHDVHGLVRFQALGDGNGRARFAAAESVIQQQAAIGGIHVQVILDDFLVREEAELLRAAAVLAAHDAGLVHDLGAIRLVEQLVDKFHEFLSIVQVVFGCNQRFNRFFWWWCLLHNLGFCDCFFFLISEALVFVRSLPSAAFFL
jgi:hypothetical protein